MIPQPIDQVPLFLRLAEEERELVTARLHRRQSASGELVFSAGQPSEGLYVVASGWVRLEDATSDRTVTLANVGAGSLLGEVDTLLGRPYTTSARSASTTQLLFLSRTDLEDLISQHPSIGIRLSGALGMRVAFLEHYLVQQRLRNVDLLSGLAEDDLRSIAKGLDYKSFARGERILEAGTPGEAIYIIEQGRARLISTSKEGDSFEELSDGALLGHTALITNKPNSANVIAVTEVSAWFLSRSTYKELIRERPAVKLAFSRALAETLSPNDQADAIDRLRQIPLFSDVPTEALEALSSRLVLRHFPSGEAIYTEGTPGDSLYVIEAGEVKLLESAAEDAPLVERVRGGNSFGEMALLTGRTRGECARASTDSTVWALYKNDFDDLMVRYPEISVSLSRALTDRLRSHQSDFLERHLRQIPLFSGLASSELRSVAARVRGLRFRPGEIICFAGQPALTLYIVEMGEVKLIGTGTGGEPLAVDLLGPGDTYGEQPIIQRNAYPATAQAIGEVELWTITKKDLDTLLEQIPGLALAVTRSMADRLTRTQQMPQGFTHPAMGVPQRTQRRNGPPQAQAAYAAQSIPAVNTAPVAPRPPMPRPRSTAAGGPRVQQPQSGARPVQKPPRPMPAQLVNEAAVPAIPVMAPSRPRPPAPPPITTRAHPAPPPGLVPHTAPPARRPLSAPARQNMAQAQPAPMARPAMPRPRPAAPPARPKPPAATLQGPRLATPAMGAVAGTVESVAAPLDAAVRSASPVRRKARPRNGASFIDEFGAWISSLSVGAKFRMASIGVLSIWFIGIVMPAAIWPTVISAVGGLTPRSNAGGVIDAPLEPSPRSSLVPTSAGKAPKLAYVPPTNTPVPTRKPVATSTPKPKPTSLPPTKAVAPPPTAPVPMLAAQQPTATAAPAFKALPPVDWDDRLGNGAHVLPHLEGVRLIPANVAHGQKFWRVTRVRFEDITESGNDHTIYVKVLDENGKRIDGKKAHLTSEGGQSEYPEEKPAGDLCDCNFNYPMFGDGYAFNIEDALPSDKVAGMIMPMRRHVNYRLTFQLATNP